VLTTSDIKAQVSELTIAKEIGQIKWVATDHPYEQAHSYEVSRSTNTALAYLQYTSSSTATPRGVMVSHRNVLAHCKALSLAGTVSTGSRSLCWLPYFHDYGLLHGIIAPSFAGIPAYLMSPLTFLRRPLRWLEAVGPISSILGTAPTLERGQVALENIARLGISLDVGLDDAQAGEPVG
jgi:acyl-CoA synthetase (AMP-forming)/AMP-acid ligase II